MDAEALRALFEPCGVVQLKRMFGGRGIYLRRRIVAIEADGQVWLKTDDLTRSAFEQVQSRPFTYAKKSGDVGVMSYWLLPEAAFDDPDVMREWVKLAEGASERAEHARLADSKHAPPRKLAAKR